MRRKLYARLKEWKGSRRKTALLIDGARRVGKTYLMLEFAKKEYEHFLYLDFSRVSSRSDVLPTLQRVGLPAQDP